MANERSAVTSSFQSLPLTPPPLPSASRPLDYHYYSSAHSFNDAIPTPSRLFTSHPSFRTTDNNAPPSSQSRLFTSHPSFRTTDNNAPPPPSLDRIPSSLSKDPKYRRTLSRILPRSPVDTPTIFSAEEDVWRGDFMLSDNKRRISSQLRPNSRNFLAFLFNARKTRHTRNLLLLILLNLAYLTVEFLIGLFSGRVGLVSDAFHLSFGCGVLTLSLYAMFMSKNSRDDIFTYGYKRLEVLAAFTNALFLLFLSFSLAVEALHAFVQDEAAHKHYLIVSAVTNLLVNLLGVWFFRSYARIRIVYIKAEDMNHHSICLHVLSDSIRSAGLILASWLLTLGVKNAETLCLGLVSVTIFVIVMPLFKAAAGILLQMAPTGISPSAFNKCLRQVTVLEDVIECFQARFWDMVPGYVVGTLLLKVKQGADEQKILKHVHSIYNEIGIKDLTVQIDFQH